MALHRTWQTDAEWLCRELQWPSARRVPQRASVQQSQRGAGDHRRMEVRLQHQPTALEPQRAHTNRVCSTPRPGAKLSSVSSRCNWMRIVALGSMSATVKPPTQHSNRYFSKL